MSPAERIYTWLLKLYPAQHREKFEEDMLLHARDMNRDADRLGRWRVARLCASLVRDGFVNAWLEHWEAGMGKKREFEPASWLVVLLAALPGLLILVTRRLPGQLTPLPLIIWNLYLVILVIGVPLIWWRIKKYPVWALLPLGALVWNLVYLAGNGLSGLASAPQAQVPGMQAGIAALNIIVMIGIAAVVLRRQRLPRAAWILVGFMVVGNLLLAVLYSMEVSRTEGLLTGLVRYFTTAGIGPLEGLMLVAVGMLFAREHGVLAILILVGGYSYMFADSDYLFGYPQRDWAWLGMYFAVITILYLIVVPVALLRAKTRLGRALAVFVPLVAFYFLHFAVPLLVIPEPVRIMPGEVVWTINILLSFVLAWIVYSEVGEIGEEVRSVNNSTSTPLVN